MIRAGVHNTPYIYDPQKFEWHFSGRLTFSNTIGRLLGEFRPDNKQNHCRTEEDEEPRLRRVLPLVAILMMSKRNR